MFAEIATLAALLPALGLLWVGKDAPLLARPYSNPRIGYPGLTEDETGDESSQEQVEEDWQAHEQDEPDEDDEQ